MTGGTDPIFAGIDIGGTNITIATRPAREGSSVYERPNQCGGRAESALERSAKALKA